MSCLPVFILAACDSVFSVISLTKALIKHSTVEATLQIQGNSLIDLRSDKSIEEQSIEVHPASARLDSTVRFVDCNPNAAGYAEHCHKLVNNDNSVNEVFRNEKFN